MNDCDYSCGDCGGCGDDDGENDGRVDDSSSGRLEDDMKKVLLLLRDGPMTESELFDAMIPGFSLELLGKLRDMEAIDHYNKIIYITSIGEKILENELKVEEAEEEKRKKGVE